MDYFEINGSKKLNGVVEVSGAKNAVLPLMAAAILNKDKLRISNVPNLSDSITMSKLLEEMGAEVNFESDNSIFVDSSNLNTPFAPYDLVKTMRASFYVLGPLLARFGKAKVSLPGGCAWGPRPVDFHLKALEKLGAKITLKSGYIIAEADKAPIHDFRIDDKNGINHVPSFFADNTYKILLISHDLDLFRNRAIDGVNDLAQFCEKNNLGFWALTSNGVEKSELFEDENHLNFKFYFGDNTNLKSIIRSNPGVLLIKNSTVVKTWPSTRLPKPINLEKLIANE